MARYMKLFRYFGETTSSLSVELTTEEPVGYYLNNYTANYNIDDNGKALLISGEFLTDECKPIIQLGILTLPGTSFFLNGNTNSIIVGISGVYELDLTNSSGTIDTILFDKTSIDNIDSNPNGYLIIDIIYEGG